MQEVKDRSVYQLQRNQNEHNTKREVNALLQVLHIFHLESIKLTFYLAGLFSHCYRYFGMKTPAKSVT